MKQTTNNNSYTKHWFTLIEIVVASTIFAIMMISVIFIFVNSSQISAKIDINRSMQENIKNIVETIAEDIRNNWIRSCDSWIGEWCVDTSQKISKSNDLWVWNNHYYLAKIDNLKYFEMKTTFHLTTPSPIWYYFVICPIPAQSLPY